MSPPPTPAAEAKEAPPSPGAHEGENSHRDGPAAVAPLAPPPPALVEPPTTTASQAMRLLGGLSPQELRRSIVMLQEHLQARERYERTTSRLIEAALTADTPRSLTPDPGTPPPAFDNHEDNRGKDAIRPDRLDTRQLSRSRSKKSVGSRGAANTTADVEKASGDAQRGPGGANDLRGPPSGGPPDPTAAQREAEEQAERNFKPKTLKFWTIIISIFLAMFLVALDRTIIGTAIPAITNEFHSVGDIGWYGSAYQLTTAASQLVFGRVYKFYNIKWTFIGCVLVFEIGSAICGAAPSSIVLIIGRAIAGLGSAGIFSGTMIIMIPMIPLRKRPMFQGVFGLVFGTASVLGPLVGGGFTDGVSWRWCFYVNLPIGAVAVGALLLTLHLPKRQIKQPSALKQFLRLDPLGTLFFVPSIVCLLIALEWGGSVYRWQDPRIIALLVVFAVLLVAFAAVQVLLPKTATVPPRIISQRSILAGAIFMLAIAGSMMMTIYFLPLWFQVVQGVSAVQSGIYTLPFVISLVVASIMGGFITQKVGYYVPVMLACPSLMAVSEGLMSTFHVGEPSSHWIGFQVIGGFGLGLGMQSASLAAQSVLPMPDVPTGIAIMFFTQQLGGAVFTSVGQNLLSTGLVSQLSRIPGINTHQITNSGSTDFVEQVPADLRPAVLRGYNHAVTRIFLVGMGVALVGVAAAVCMEWRNIKKTGPPAAPAPAPAPSRRPSSRASAASAATAEHAQPYQHHHHQHHHHAGASSSRGSLSDLPSSARPLSSHPTEEKAAAGGARRPSFRDSVLLRDSATLRDSTIAGSEGGSVLGISAGGKYMYRSAAGSSTQLSAEDEGLRPFGRDYHAR